MDKDNKKRLMLMKEVLEKYSDEDHPLTTAQIIEILDKEYNCGQGYQRPDRNGCGRAEPTFYAE